MRVAMYYRNNDVRVEEMPKPVIGDDELLFKVHACGICGSDVMEWYRIKRAPLVLGHEAAGEIVEVGRNLRRYKIGDRIFVSHHVPCNICRYCRSGDHTVCEMLQATNYFPGGFSEYVRVPLLNVDRGVFILPGEISYEEATFIEPLACVLRGHRMVALKPEQTVLILGAGISGLIHLLAARAYGIGRIVAADINAYRLGFAKELGATALLNAHKDIVAGLRGVNENRLADVVIVCTGAYSAFEQALKCVDRAGTILFFAPTEPGVTLPVPVNDFWRQSIKLTHSYGASPQDIEEAMALLRDKKVPVARLITHRLGLQDVGLGFKLASEAKDCIKVIIEPNK